MASGEHDARSPDRSDADPSASRSEGSPGSSGNSIDNRKRWTTPFSMISMNRKRLFNLLYLRLFTVSIEIMQCVTVTIVDLAGKRFFGAIDDALVE